MEAMQLKLPRPVAEMCADLAGQGFDILYEQRGVSGDLLLVLQGPVRAGEEWVETFVKISSDRGHWSIAVRFGDMSRWIWTQHWEAHLDRIEPGEPDVARQTALVRYRLAEAAGAIRSDPGVEQKLIRSTEIYLRNRLGLPTI
jgi:hypothetical protein